MNGETTKDEGAQAYAQTGHSDLVEELREIVADPMVVNYIRKTARDAAAALTAQAEEIARLTRERDEAQAKERERCAKIADKFARDGRDMGNYVAASWAMDVAAAIRGGKP